MNIKRLLFGEIGGLGISRLSLVTVICNDIGDDSQDSVVKVRRMINRRGPQFCQIAEFPFMRPTTVSFTITSSAYTYSGADYLPTTYKRIVSAYLLDGTTRYDLKEDDIREFSRWENPDDNTGRPDKFCITRISSGYWEIAFNRLPDQDYTIYFEIEQQWSDLTSDTDETLITKEYYDAFAHYCTMGMLKQQGDIEQYTVYKNEWYDPLNPRQSILGQILASLKKPLQDSQVMMSEDYLNPFHVREDYDKGPQVSPR